MFKILDCGCSFELPLRGGSNEYNNLCFEKKYEKYQSLLSEHLYLDRRVFVMHFYVMLGVNGLKFTTKYTLVCVNIIIILFLFLLLILIVSIVITITIIIIIIIFSLRNHIAPC